MESDLLIALILGIVQGVTEFLPISSSGHLTIAGALMQKAGVFQLDSAAGMRLNIALHTGTLASILVVFRTDVLKLLRVPKHWGPVIVATIPLVIVGLALKDQIEAKFTDPLFAGVCLLVTAVILMLGHRLDRARRSDQPSTRTEDVTMAQGFGIGLFQAAAILPGISRSGSTIAGGLMLGLRRETAARFSFLIAIPAIAGAAVLLIKDVLQAETSGASSAEILPLLFGAMVAFLVGWAALKWLLHIVARGQLPWFAAYCCVVGITTIVWQFAT